jgi:hypothetical protein
MPGGESERTFGSPEHLCAFADPQPESKIRFDPGLRMLPDPRPSRAKHAQPIAGHNFDSGVRPRRPLGRYMYEPISIDRILMRRNLAPPFEHQANSSSKRRGSDEIESIGYAAPFACSTSPASGACPQVCRFGHTFDHLLISSSHDFATIASTPRVALHTREPRQRKQVPERSEQGTNQKKNCSEASRPAVGQDLEKKIDGGSCAEDDAR